MAHKRAKEADMARKQVNLDDSSENADWTKQSWDLPPYMSPGFLAIVPDVEAFKKSQTYKNAERAGLILDDEWVDDHVSTV
jgi:hypothetical protein